LSRQPDKVRATGCAVVNQQQAPELGGNLGQER
jgi:hypothetical protein